MAIYIPSIRNYAPFYIKRSTDSLAVNIQTEWGVTIKTHEYPSKRKAKEPYRNDWKDRDGVDEWNDLIFYEPFDYTLECVILTEESDSESSRAELKTRVRAFQNAIRNGAFRTWDAWTNFGFQNVRVSEFQQISDDDFSNLDGHCRLIFNMVLRVNDPVTEMRFTNGGDIIPIS